MMPATNSEEHGVKIESQSCEFFCMPPKKRHLHRFQSMATILEPLNVPQRGSQPQHIPPAVKNEYVTNAQVACFEEAMEKKTSDGKEGSSSCQNPVIDNFHNLHQVPLCETDATVDTMAVDSGKCDLDGKQPGGDECQLGSGEMDLQSAFKEANQHCLSGSVAERIPGDQSAVQKIKDKNSNRPSVGRDYEGSIVKQEMLYTCSVDMGFPKGPTSSHCKMEDSDCCHLQSNRSKWDLNTMMDSWEGSPAVASEDLAGGGEYGQASGDPGDNEMKNSTGVQSHENSHSDAQFNLELSSCSIDKFHLKVEEPHSLPTPNGSDLNLSTKPLTANSGASVSLSAPIKTEPCTDLGHGDRSQSGVSPQLLVSRAVKPEPCEEVVKDCSSFTLPKNLEVCGDMACIPCAKLEPQDPISLLGIGTMDDEASPPLLPANEDEPDRNSGNTNSLSDFTSADQIAECSNHDTYQVKFAPGHCALQISSVSSECNFGPASKFQDSDNKMLRNPSPGHLARGPYATDHTKTSETVCQTDGTISNPASYIITNSLVTRTASPTASEGKPNVYENQYLISEAAVPMPSELSLLDQGVSESTAQDSNLECKLPSDCTRLLKVNVPDNPVQKSVFDILTSPPSVFPMQEKSSENMNEEKIVPNGDVSSQISKVEPHAPESVGSLRSVVATQLKPKHHMDEDDDIEDGEVRDLHVQRTSSRSLCDGKEIVQTCVKEPGSIVDSVVLPSTSLLKGETETKVKIQENAQSSLDSSGNSRDENVGTIKGSPGDIKSTTFEAVSESDRSKGKLVKTSIKISKDDSGKETCNVTKQHGKSSSGSYKALVEDGMGEVGSCMAEPRGSKLSSDYTGPSKPRLSERANESNVQRSNSRSCIVHLIPDRKDSAGIAKSTERKSLPSWVERERLREWSCDGSFKGEASYRRGSRWDENRNKEWRKFEKGSRKEEPSNNKGENDLARCRGRNDKQLETLCGEWNSDADYVSERWGRSNNYRFLKSRNTSEGAFAGVDLSVENSGRAMRDPPMDDRLGGLARASHRRRSPGARDRPMNVGVQIIRRPMRDVSPERCADGASNLHLLGHDERYMQRMTGDVVDPPAIADAHPNYDREGAFIQRGRSISPPLLRRGPSRLTRLRSPSSNRRARSPRQWSPQRSHDAFDVRREAIPGRSPPNLHVVRVRSPPHPRECYMEGVPGRRCASPPCIPRLRDDMRDVGPPREFEYARGGVPIQRNVRRLRLIDTRMNGAEEYFGLMRPRPRIHELLEDESLGDRRGAGERHGIVRPLRRRYGDAVEEDLDFQIEHEGPRPVRFRVGEEEFLERGRPGAESIRSRLGELPRRLRSMEERDDGRMWHDADLDDARIKRRRF